MIRIAIAIGIIAAVACSHPSSLGNRQPQHSVVADSNYVSGHELREDARQGHTVLYDALKSTRPEILRSGNVYFDNPLGFVQGPFRTSALRTISTVRVKWIRLYSAGMAPPLLNYHAGALLVSLR